MANLLTTAQVREHVETDLVDTALARLNDDADAEVIRRLGALTGIVEKFVTDNFNYPHGRDKFIHLTRSLSSITSISEQVLDADPVILATDDYDIVGSRLERLNTGTNGRSLWGHRLIITYVPLDDTKSRIVTVIDLIKLEVEYRGLSTEKAGDYQMSAPDYQAQRNAIFKRLQPGLSFA